MTDTPNLAEFFECVVGAGDTTERGVLLVELAKMFDLASDACRVYCDTIASWIGSSNDEVRRAVVFALCFVRPVRGYEYVAVRGWLKAPVVDLHWYASAIESALTSKAMISNAVLVAVASRMFAAERDFVQKRPRKSGLELQEAMDDVACIAKETMRVFQHLQSIVRDGVRDISDVVSPQTDLLSQVDWRCVAETFYCCARGEC